MCKSYSSKHQVPLVSVIIPNHGRDISITREVLKGQDVEILEIDLGRERSYQRNYGIEKANGEYLLVLDSDQVPSSRLIPECVEIMEKNPDCQGIYIPEKIVGTDWFTRLRDFERQFYTGSAVDCVRFVRKGCPLFDESMTGPEDADWDLRITGQKLISKNPLYHYDGIRLRDYIGKKVYYTKSMARFSEKHPNARVMSLRYRCWTVFVENGKWKRLVRSPFYTIKLMSLLALRGVIYLCLK